MWPAASLALVETLAAFFFGPYIGVWIDKTSRLLTMRLAVVAQNLALLAASACFYAFIWLELASEGAVPVQKPKFWVTMNLLYFTAGINSVSFLADSVSLKKIWVPAICGANSKSLRSANATMKRINLICEIGGPLTFGCLLSFLPEKNTIPTSLICVVIFNLCCLIPQLIILQNIFVRVSSLQQPPTSEPKSVSNPLLTAFWGWGSYANHHVFLASLSYSFLYVTVLSPGVLMTSFLNYWSISQWEIAVFRGLCAVTGILATVLANPVMEKFGVVNAGIIFSWIQWAFLVPSCIAAFLPSQGYNWGIYLFMAMVILSRMGLWGFDLVEVNIMQTRVLKTEAGKINAVEYSATQFASLIPYICGIFSNNPNFFVWLVLGSAIAVFSAAVLFSYWAVNISRNFVGSASIQS